MLTTPVIRALHQQLGAEIHLLTKKSFSGVLQANPYLHQTWAIEQKVAEVLPQLREQKFTAIIDLHSNLRSLQVRLGLFGTPYYRFHKLNQEKWLLTRWKINRMPDVHIVDRYLATTQSLGIQNDGKGLDHFIPEEDQVAPSSLGLAAPYVALVIGAAHATKRLPEEKLIALCIAIPHPILLLGGPGEQTQGERIAKTAGEHVINSCGHLRLHQSASMVEQAAVVVTHDTGLMHMAAAFGRPIVSIWGNTVPEFGMYPYNPQQQYPSHIMEVKALACRPCSKIGYEACPKGHFDCMEQQSITQIAAQVVAYF